MSTQRLDSVDESRKLQFELYQVEELESRFEMTAATAGWGSKTVNAGCLE